MTKPTPEMRRRWQKSHEFTSQRAVAGATMTFENAQGEHLTLHRPGKPTDAVRVMCAVALRRDESFRVVSHSTPETVLSDLQGNRAMREQGGRLTVTTLPEAVILGRVGLSAMLHPRISR